MLDDVSHNSFEIRAPFETRRGFAVKAQDRLCAAFDAVFRTQSKLSLCENERHFGGIEDVFHVELGGGMEEVQRPFVENSDKRSSRGQDTVRGVH